MAKEGARSRGVAALGQGPLNILWDNGRDLWIVVAAGDRGGVTEGEAAGRAAAPAGGSSA